MEGTISAAAVPWGGCRLDRLDAAGWGWFNLVEAVVDHQLLGLHHVVEARGLSIFDWLFTASGVVLIVVGHIIGRRTSEYA